jgi:hypothetical protein
MDGFDTVNQDLIADLGGYSLPSCLSITVLDRCGSAIEFIPKKLSGRRLTVHLAREIPPGTCIRIDYEDSLLLAEVVRCWQGGAWIEATIELQHSLVGIAKLCSVLDEGPC